ncbi:SLC13 family permease [Nannocystis pusilla]|uniref:Permease n=1 Tax=Nannocystis pusilla TaxID=889268 RepID=A0ABS7U5Y1_9BACT|nr:SLC13 family permease [Nannocystis pusilla]MBZ5715720.1 permease [Nannocystis pusilla]
MIVPQLLLAALLLAALITQAVLPAYRVLIVVSAAGLAVLVARLYGTVVPGGLLGAVPWDVLIILVSLGALSSVLAESRLFDRLAVVATRISRGDPTRVTIVFAAVMYVVSGLVNNLTALLLVMPVQLVLFRLIGVERRYVAWSLGLMLVACNLGGAATPIGDFPAILMLGGGRMTFLDYLVRAGPTTALIFLVLLAAVIRMVRPAKHIPSDPLSTRISCTVIEAMHRRVLLRRRIAWPAAAILGLMFGAWTVLPADLGVTPELVCWLGGAATMLISPRVGEDVLRRRFDAEAVLFLLAMFIMVLAVRSSGLFETLARALVDTPLPIGLQLGLFLVLAGVATALFSAGPSMAALLEVADVLARELPGHVVYVGLALSVCAGSSCLLTAATSGPLAQALCERADLRDAQGEPIRFGFFEFLRVGLLSFVIIETGALGYAAWALYT